VIVALTEGLVNDIAKGVSAKSQGQEELKLIGTYVESPLCWAISTAAESHLNVESLHNAKWGISRFSSGSHLMAIVLAHQRGWKLEELQFEVLGNFESLRNGVNGGKAAAFMWETFTSKPYHDSGEIRRAGEIVTPWPCFMMAGTKSTLDGKTKEIASVLSAIREACQIFHSETETIPSYIGRHYNLKPVDAQAWYDQVKITASPNILQSALSRTLTSLKEAKVLPEDNDCQPIDIIDTRFATLESKDIKNMRLYNRPELITRTYNELRARGWVNGGLKWEQLGVIDQQHHYHGASAVDTAIEIAKITSTSNVLSLGSGLGGPARYISGKTGASVLAIELQADLSQVAEELTQRTGLSSKVHHMAADFMAAYKHLRLDSYNAIVSWLTVLHISEKDRLFEGCHEILAPNGIFYAEDWYLKGEAFTPSEQASLRDDVYCNTLLSEDAYKNALRNAGLEVLQFQDLTTDWTKFCADRVANMEKQKKELVKLHGADMFDRLQYFYKRVSELFDGGNLGGVRVVARKTSST
jgi:cyclopropane fatty-acyl-phospholipid synthase-like methyltransferase